MIELHSSRFHSRGIEFDFSLYIITKIDVLRYIKKNFIGIVRFAFDKIRKAKNILSILVPTNRGCILVITLLSKYSAKQRL